MIFDYSGSPEEYIASAVHKRVKPPPVCPACQRSESFEPLGYYSRGLTAKDRAGVLSITVRRFRCTECGISLSLLPNFAQPYRLVRNETVQEFFDRQGRTTDGDRWGCLLRRYWRRFSQWFPHLILLTGIRAQRGPPLSKPERFWSRFKELWGPLVSATANLIREFRVTPFGSYRCHQVPV
jgi:hypothetical protein